MLAANLLRSFEPMDLDFYKGYASDPAFRRAIAANISRVLDSGSGLQQLRF